MIKKTFPFLIFLASIAVLDAANTQYEYSIEGGERVWISYDAAIHYAISMPLDATPSIVEKAKQFYKTHGVKFLIHKDILRDFCKGSIAKERLYGIFLALKDAEAASLNEGCMQKNMCVLHEIFSNSK